MTHPDPASHSRRTRPSVGRQSDDGPPPASPADGPLFDELIGFDPASLTLIHLDLSGFHVVPDGEGLADQRVGHTCGDPNCSTALVVCDMVPTRHALVSTLIMPKLDRWPETSPAEYIRGLSVGVASVRSVGPVPIVDMRAHLRPGILYRYPLNPAALRLDGGAAAQHSPSWRLIREIRRAHPEAVGIVLNCFRSREDIDTFLFFRDSLDRLDEGPAVSLSRALPATSREAPGLVARLLGLLGRRLGTAG